MCKGGQLNRGHTRIHVRTHTYRVDLLLPLLPASLSLLLHSLLTTHPTTTSLACYCTAAGPYVVGPETSEKLFLVYMFACPPLRYCVAAGCYWLVCLSLSSKLRGKGRWKKGRKRDRTCTTYDSRFPVGTGLAREVSLVLVRSDEV